MLGIQPREHLKGKCSNIELYPWPHCFMTVMCAHELESNGSQGLYETNKTVIFLSLPFFLYPFANTFVCVRVEFGPLREGWSHRTVGRVLAFCAANLGSVPGTPYGFLSPTGVMPNNRIRSKS